MRTRLLIGAIASAGAAAAPDVPTSSYPWDDDYWGPH